MALNPDPSNLDQNQILQRVMDNSNDRLRVDAEVTAVIGSVEIDSTTSSVLDVGTEDGTFVGTQHVINVDHNGYQATLVKNTLVTEPFDYVQLTNSVISGQTVPTIVAYKLGGSGGTLVATLTLAYDGSANLTSVTKT